ncbi:MAG: LUD domain-containing protein [Prevotella sp.]|jgi:L-lactate dehydrogenase complex protein LldG|nr:LUD domain-containing protein [Prevotella sp.]MBQ6194423.1 LUD domain-containing protein [Prevotella sp.]MBR0527209.1 LUD domain-containing protein [Prevotella sp.]
MSSKEDILRKYRANVREQFPMPDLSDLQAVHYDNPLQQFVEMSQSVGARVVPLAEGQTVEALVKTLYPDAREIASNLPEVAAIATRNPDTVVSAEDLNGTDVGVIRGEFGVAENGCIWIPQHMQQRAVCFISENLVILLPKSQVVSNMHEAYRRLRTAAAHSGTAAFDAYGYGTFISGPSKTADIAQVLVMGAQAARTVTVVLLNA